MKIAGSFWSWTVWDNLVVCLAVRWQPGPLYSRVATLSDCWWRLQCLARKRQAVQLSSKRAWIPSQGPGTPKMTWKWTFLFLFDVRREEESVNVNEESSNERENNNRQLSTPPPLIPMASRRVLHAVTWCLHVFNFSFFLSLLFWPHPARPCRGWWCVVCGVEKKNLVTNSFRCLSLRKFVLCSLLSMIRYWNGGTSLELGKKEKKKNER